jgi:hypothetical protein
MDLSRSRFAGAAIVTAALRAAPAPRSFRPRVGNIDTLDIINIREVIKIGEEAVDEILPQLKQKFTLRKCIRRALGAKA